VAPPVILDAGAASAWIGQRLEEASILYAIGGALALAAHGIPRMTDDVDLSVFVPEAELDGLFDALERAGCLFEREHARADVARMNLFGARCGRIWVDLFVSFHPHHHEALARRVQMATPNGQALWFLSAEDLAIHKLALSRAKDLPDLERLFAAHGRAMDIAYVRHWIEKIALEPGDRRRATLGELERRFVEAR
jgi:hypothetical protein